MKQKQVFYQTALKEISITNGGTVRNNKTGKFLKISERGYFILNNKPQNLPKLMLQTFKKIALKNGRIRFKDNDKRNFDVENIEYVTKLAIIPAPDEKDLESIIYTYFKDDDFKMGDWLQFRIYINMIMKNRGFFEENKNENNIDVFSDYFSVSFPSYISLAKRNKISIKDAKTTVYFFLNRLVSNCKNDAELRLKITNDNSN